MKKNNLKKQLYCLFLFSVIFNIYSQNDAFTNEVTYRGEKVFFNNKPLTGWLFSEQDGIPNDCDCILKAKYTNGLLNGEKKEWYSNGKPKLSAIYKNGKLASKKIYFKNGKIKKDEKYNNGTLIKSVLYNRDGSIKSNTNRQIVNNNKVTYSPTQQQPNTNNTLVNYQTNTSNTTEQNTLDYNTIYKEGLINILYPNGNKKRISLYKSNLIVKDSLFFETGDLQMSKKYMDGELVHTEEYNKSKKLIKEENFLNNKKNGKQQENYKDGTPKLIEIYDNGSLIHKEKYTNSGLPLLEENYKFNKKNDLQKIYDADGKIKKIEKYNLGVLEKTEKFTNTGKEVIIIKNNLTEIKTYNNKGLLISNNFENTLTKLKDSVETKYNPNNGYKIYECAYKNGKIIRKGNYKNNKKDGLWHFFYSNNKGEKSEFYSNGKIIKDEEIIYANQIKNSYKTQDYLFAYQTPGRHIKNNYILLKFNTENKEEIINKIKDLNVTVFKNKFKYIKDTIGLSNIQLYAKIVCSDINYRFKPKEGNPNKYIVYIKEKLHINQLKDSIIAKRDFVFTPVNQKNTSINSLYTKDKTKAFNQTKNNLKTKISKYIETIFPQKALLYRVISQSKTEIKKIRLYTIRSNEISEKDIFILKGEGNDIKVKFIVTSITEGVVFCKVETGGKWLFNYLKNNKNPILEKFIL